MRLLAILPVILVLAGCGTDAVAPSVPNTVTQTVTETQTVTVASVPAPSSTTSTRSKAVAPRTTSKDMATPATKTIVTFKNCSEVKAAGKAPIRPGDPGWQKKFDADNDGIGCE